MDKIISMFLQNLAFGLIALAAAYATLYLNKAAKKALEESKKIKNEAQRELAQNAINRIYNLTGDVVAAAQTTLVEQVKATAEDGKLTKEDGERIAKAVKEDVLKMADDKLIDLAKTEVSDLDAYIAVAIEKQLGIIKGQIPSDK